MSATAKCYISASTDPEPFELMEALWDSLIESPDTLPLNDAQRAVLDQRLAAYEKNPAEDSTRYDVRAHIRRP